MRWCGGAVVRWCFKTGAGVGGGGGLEYGLYRVQGRLFRPRQVRFTHKWWLIRLW